MKYPEEQPVQLVLAVYPVWQVVQVVALEHEVQRELIAVEQG